MHYPDDPYISYKSILIDRHFKFVSVRALLLFQASLTVNIQTINPFIYKMQREKKGFYFNVCSFFYRFSLFALR
jgi:hypothetical protein